MSINDYPAVGKVIAINDDSVIFRPVNTNYELQLLTSGRIESSVGQRVEGLIRLSARKLYTVSSGGNFITPIFGPPRIVQGRIKFLDEKTMVVQAATPVIVELPARDSGYDMECGPLKVGNLVNVAALPGASFALAAEPATR